MLSVLRWGADATTRADNAVRALRESLEEPMTRCEVCGGEIAGNGPVPDANTLSTLHGQIGRLYARIWELEQELRQLRGATAPESAANSRDRAGNDGGVIVLEDDGQIEP